LAGSIGPKSGTVFLYLVESAVMRSNSMDVEDGKVMLALLLSILLRYRLAIMLVDVW
jgi:hypothetical protein